MTLHIGPFDEMTSIIARYAKKDGNSETAIENLHVFKGSCPTRLQHVAYKPSFSLVLQGSKRLMVGSDVHVYGAGQYVLTSLDLPVASHVTQATADVPYLCFTLFIDSEKLSDLLPRTKVSRATPSPEDSRGLVVKTAPPELIDASARLLRLLDNPDDIAAMAPLIEQEISYRLLTGPDGSRLLDMTLAESQSHKVARAVAWLRTNFAEALRIEALADHVSMSVSSLHHHFKAVTAMTPMQYQKQLRLHEARRLLLTERVDVATAGYRVGYQSPSQFSREYGRLYGLPPLKDIDAMRGQMAAE
ncbi:AraC family transcriptional regulator [Rhizobium sp. BE258]|uniref:AraC family transcriptional regulator n=1 Tax=Rhizobium sp. BE258 TaxID=2817722 RepID=UPI00285F1221|nr:AraC family transcriptional regulator [Rhizobium sp. BE258]MDR7144602.1 AraC-like DNA-binding protein [Rhizobium sp. BE258]